MGVVAKQVDVTSTTIFSASSSAYNDEVTIQNLGPNPIYIDFGEAATTAGSMQLPAGAVYTCKGNEDITAITTVLQVTPNDTRVSVERN